MRIRLDKGTNVVKVTDVVTAHFHGNYRESPRRHRHCWQPGRRNDTAPIHTKLSTILPQCTEDHVSCQLYNKDHLPLGWFSGGFSSRRLTTSGHSVARSLSLAFWFGLLESSHHSQFPSQSSDVTAWLLHGLHYNVEMMAEQGLTEYTCFVTKRTNWFLFFIWAVIDFLTTSILFICIDYQIAPIPYIKRTEN